MSIQRKVIVFDGGPYHNQFREISEDQTIVEVLVEGRRRVGLETGPIDLERRYYKETSTKYNNIPVFVWIEIKPKENESDNKDTEVG